MNQNHKFCFISFLGPMVADWIKHMEERSKNGDVKQLYLYSGHDLTIVNSLRALGIKDFILPEFGSALVVELHYSHLSHFVHVGFNIIHIVKMFLRNCYFHCS